MNLYIEFNATFRYLNLKPADPDACGFSYYRTDNGRLEHSTSSFSSYISAVLTYEDIRYYLFTPASTLEELYALHPELSI